MHVDEAIRTRRTHKQYDGTPVSRETVHDLIQAAVWAPNHRHTEPWRFVVALGEQRIGLANAVGEALDSMRKPDVASDVKLETKKRKFLRRAEQAGAIVVVTYVTSPENPGLDREDYAATACAVQNMQLAATARGLVCQWSTSKVFERDPVRRFLGQPAGEELVAALFIGHPVAPLEGRRGKSVDDVTRFLG